MQAGGDARTSLDVPFGHLAALTLNAIDAEAPIFHLVGFSAQTMARHQTLSACTTYVAAFTVAAAVPNAPDEKYEAAILHVAV